jgi:hypothetical protein
MWLVLALLVFSEEPGAIPGGPDTGYVPPPRQKEPPKEPGPATQPGTRVAPGGAGEGGKTPVARSAEEFAYQLIRKKDPFGALTIFEELLRNEPNDAGARLGKATALYEIAKFFQRRGRFEEAQKTYEEALKTDPGLATDEEFNWHRALLKPAAHDQKKVNVYDPRPKMLQQPWIGPQLRVGAQGLVAPGLSLQVLDFMRIDAGIDPIFFGAFAQLNFHFPWQWSPYLAIGGKLSFLYSPIGSTPRRANFEIWQASFMNLGVGVQYRHPMGLFFTLGIDMLYTGGIIGAAANANTELALYYRDVFFPIPIPQFSFGWLFGG